MSTYTETGSVIYHNIQVRCKSVCCPLTSSSLAGTARRGQASVRRSTEAPRSRSRQPEPTNPCALLSQPHPASEGARLQEEDQSAGVRLLCMAAATTLQACAGDLVRGSASRGDEWVGGRNGVLQSPQQHGRRVGRGDVQQHAGQQAEEGGAELSGEWGRGNCATLWLCLNWLTCSLIPHIVNTI